MSIQGDGSAPHPVLTHATHQEYTYRLPTAPRITVPPPCAPGSSTPPSLINDTMPGLQTELDMSFLKDIDLTETVQQNTMTAWSYEHRRQAQVILPWLWLGPLAAVKDRDFLARENFTLILAVRASSTTMNGILRVLKEQGANVATIEAADAFTLTGKFADASRLINQHVHDVWTHSSLAGGGGGGRPQVAKVLVFCESGNEKSASVAAAYLMTALRDCDHIRAMQMCQTQRFCANFDDGAKLSLRSYWDIVAARRSTTSSTRDLYQRADEAWAASAGLEPGAAAATLRPMHGPKRRRELDADEDELMRDGSDAEDGLRFEGRANTPFLDG